MYEEDQAKLYYLYMLADGELSENEKKIYNRICAKLNLSKENKETTIKECHEIIDEESLNCLDILEMNAKEDSYYSGANYLRIRDSDFISESEKNKLEDKAKILWNLINLGYADKKFSVHEREVVKFLKDFWSIPESIYKEMIDVAETCLFLESEKSWLESLENTDKTLTKIETIEENIRYTINSIKTTISEIDF